MKSPFLVKSPFKQSPSWFPVEVCTSAMATVKILLGKHLEGRGVFPLHELLLHKAVW